MDSSQNREASLDKKSVSDKYRIKLRSGKFIQEAGSSNITSSLQVPGIASGYILHKNESLSYDTKPLEGGYAWVILFAAFFIGVITEGNIMSVGAILPGIEKDFSVEKYTTAFIASSQTTTYYCMGIITSAFINKLSFRTVAFFGLTISILGLIIGSFCTDSISLTIFFGFFFGSGVGMLAMVSQLIVAHYFEKYRGGAVGLQSSSAGIGLLLYGPLNSYLTRNFNWSVNLRLMTVSFLFCYACCAVFKKCEPIKVDLRTQSDNSSDSNSEEAVEIESRIYSYFSKTDLKEKNKEEVFLASMKQKQSQMLLAPAGEGKMENSVTDSSNIENIIVIEIDDGSEVKSEENTSIYSEKEQKANTTISEIHEKSDEDQEKCCTINQKIIAALKILFDLKLLKSTPFQIIQIASCFLIMGHAIPFLYVIERTRIPSFYSNWLLSFIGIVNIILRILLGITAQYTKEYTAYLCGGCIIFGGIGVLISCFVTHNHIWLEFFYCGMFTFSSAAFFSLDSIVIINAIGIDNLINAFGLIYLGAGVLTFISTNIAGNLVTYFHSTEPAFIMSTCFLIISGVLFTISPTIIKHLKTEEHENYGKDIEKINFLKKLFSGKNKK